MATFVQSVSHLYTIQHFLKDTYQKIFLFFAVAEAFVPHSVFFFPLLLQVSVSFGDKEAPKFYVP